MSESGGPYERRLRALFERFVSDGETKLDGGSLGELCAELQLPDRASLLLLAGDASLDFDGFRSRLLALLEPRAEARASSAPRSLSPVDARARPAGLRRCLSAPQNDYAEEAAEDSSPSEDDDGELRTLRSALERAEAERDKFRADLRRADERAALLAEEVDETHSKLEAATNERLERSERRRIEEARRSNAAFEEERERTSRSLSELEARATRLERELADSELNAQTAKLEIERLDAERRELTAKLSESNDINEKLLANASRLAAEVRSSSSEESGELRRRIAELIEENAALRDEYDESCAEAENLRSELAKSRNRHSPHQNGVKRGISPSASPTEPPSEEESPRISKIRKRNDVSDSEPKFTVDQHFTDRLVSFLLSLLKSDFGESVHNLTKNDYTEIVQFLKNQHCDVVSEVISISNHKCYYLTLCYLLFMIKNDIRNIPNVVQRFEAADFVILKKCLEEFCDTNLECVLQFLSRYFDDYNDNYDNSNELLEKLKMELENEKLEKQNETLILSEKIAELQNNLESLKNAYEECEEYWSVKLNEERDIFDQERQINNEKFSELMDKLAEYEEEFGFNKSKNSFYQSKLSTIDEKCGLEKQFNDLEDEFKIYKSQTIKDIEVKNNEISMLNEKIISLQANINKNSSSVNDINENNIKTVDNISNSLYLENVSPVTSPIEYLWNQKTISSPLCKKKTNDKVRDYQNPQYLKQKYSSKPQQTIKPFSNNSNPELAIQKPKSTLNSTKSTDYSLKEGSKQIEGKILHCSDLEEALQGRRKDSDGNKLHNNIKSNVCNQENSHLKIAWLEICCQQLQTSFKQQQMYYESLMQQTLVIHREEVEALRQKLEASDLLIRELYVENCHLSGGINHPRV